jgi:hypothetical protein
MLALFELLGWIADIAGLDLKTMKPVTRVLVVIVFGGFGLLFLCAGLLPLFDSDKDGLKIFGGLVVSAIGFGLLARIIYGLVELRRNRGPT